MPNVTLPDLDYVINAGGTELQNRLTRMQKNTNQNDIFVCSEYSCLTFNIAINCCCHYNWVDYAFLLLASTFKRGFVPDVATYTTLIRGLVSQHKSAEARLFFTNLIKFRQVQPNVVTFNTMINGLCKRCHTDIALWLFRFMEKCHCAPDSITYNTVIDSLCKGGLVDDALNLHSEVMEKRILPDVWTYPSIIQVLCSLKRWEEVGLLLNQMIYDMKISPDVQTFSILVDAYSKSGKLDDAKYIIQMMNERGEYPNIVTYNTLMQAYCSQGQMDGALAVLNTIKSKKIMPISYTYNILLDAYCRDLKLDIAKDLYRKMAFDGLSRTVITHNILLHGLCLLDRDTYNIIIRGCLSNKKYDEACKLVDKMVDFGFLADAITSPLLKYLLLSGEQDPNLLAMHQKFLHSGFTAL
ncbi:hypothetical protein POM88_023701 [Heracleum sosnowskyi]|uniref:Pentatricopeptide repeat-containing protein n=1 Tax=Heracleum sosnowskyi TaxID=360622 RepID=A0AAD8MUN7_9APIA|nr:hypothetical protein POM88_023701 [Heracleum sosnowskyi]